MPSQTNYKAFTNIEVIPLSFSNSTESDIRRFAVNRRARRRLRLLVRIFEIVRGKEIKIEIAKLKNYFI